MSRRPEKSSLELSRRSQRPSKSSHNVLNDDGSQHSEISEECRINIDSIEKLCTGRSRKKDVSDLSELSEFGADCKSSWACVWYSVAASMGGGVHGFNQTLMSGIVGRADFQQYFIPEFMNQPSSTNIFCPTSAQRLSLISSSMFIAAIIGDFSGIPAWVTRYKGRSFGMKCAASLFIIAAILQTFSVNLGMLVCGRCLTGVAISFETISVLLYLSEIAPPGCRGRYNQFFELQITGGILLVTVLNYAFRNIHPIGWRYVMGFGIFFSTLFLISTFMIPDSPSSLMERGDLSGGRSVLTRLRKHESSLGQVSESNEQIEKEYEHMFISAEKSRLCKSPWSTILRRRHRPQLYLAFLSTFFRQFTGITFVIIQASPIFTIFLGNKLLANRMVIVLYTFNHISTYISYFLADKRGRCFLLKCGGVQMFISLIILASLLISGVGLTNSSIPWAIFAFICLFDIGYAYSWGPVGWLYPTEIAELEIRSSAISVASGVNLSLSFVVSQFSLPILCGVKASIFYFFAFCVTIMTVAVHFLFIETKGFPVEQSWRLYANHPVWASYMT